MKKSIPSYCKDCSSLSTRGIKDNIHNMWCCKVGQPVWKCISHCKLHNLKVIKEILK